MITDEMLSQAAAELARAINNSLPTPSECTHEFSAVFERKMKRLMRKTHHPILHRTLRAVACFILVIMLGLGSVLTVSAEAREIVFGWVKQQYESFYSYFFEGNSEISDSTQYIPGWMPVGYELVDSFEIEGGEMYLYHSPDETVAQFFYSSSPSSLKVFIESVDYEKHDTQINGLPGEIYLSNSSVESNVLVWFDNASNTMFNVSGHLAKEELVFIAENILSQ